MCAILVATCHIPSRSYVVFFGSTFAGAVPPCYGLIISRYRYISIGILYNVIAIFLFTLYIVIYIHQVYNNANLEEVRPF